MAAAALGWAGGCASVAGANGAPTIATAPELPLDVQTFSGWSYPTGAQTSPYHEYWRVTLGASDRLTIDVGVTEDECSGESRGIDVFSPSVTDYTVGRTNPTIEHSTTFHDMDEFVWTAPFAGRWTLRFYGCQTLGYQFAAHVAHPTQLALRAPRVLAAGRKLRVKGTVGGLAGAGGKVAVKLRAPHRKKITRLRAVSRTGKFSWAVRVRRPGRYRLSAKFFGDAHHLASSARRTIHVL